MGRARYKKLRQLRFSITRSRGVIPCSTFCSIVHDKLERSENVSQDLRRSYLWTR